MESKDKMPERPLRPSLDRLAMRKHGFSTSVDLLDVAERPSSTPSLVGVQPFQVFSPPILRRAGMAPRSYR